MANEPPYQLKHLPDRFCKLGPMVWLLDYYIEQYVREGDPWVNDGRPVSDEAVAPALGTTEEIIEQWRWFLAHEELIRQKKMKGIGWLISLNPAQVEILEGWLEARRRLLWEREKLLW